MVDSNYNYKTYSTKDAIRIVNPTQAAFYWSKHCEPLDIYPSKNFKTNKPIIVYVFSRQQTQDSGAYDEWCLSNEDNR